ncbi:MAG: FAD-binding oxidoreductase [Hyphomicrobiales bacterium]|nr:FAD-binding oxidoreductase [Hyphomicrobiales bacterium]
MSTGRAEIVVIGAGVVGLACAYYLSLHHRAGEVLIVDPRPPMSLTSAASGENYRNWWPHPVMTAYTDYSIDLMEAIARESANRIHMTRRGYVLATRKTDPTAMLEKLGAGYASEAAECIRVHVPGASNAYRPAELSDWERAPDGVDVLQGPSLIGRHFPSFDPAIAMVLHIRRAGDISGQQLGALMLENVRSRGGSLRAARVVAIERGVDFVLTLRGRDGVESVRAGIVVNAAGPYVGDIAAMLGESLPISNVFQQKIAFADHEGAIDRNMPFSIDLDRQLIDWTDEERSSLREDTATCWLTEPMPGAIHCRPDGGEQGQWIKLGWAYNRAGSQPTDEPATDPNFPEIVLRGASRLNPRLKRYYGRLPRQMSHYGGFYTMTEENWPLIGPMRTRGAYVVGALSGFGTMGACAAGALCAAWVRDTARPAFASALSLARYEDKVLMRQLLDGADTGVL